MSCRVIAVLAPAYGSYFAIDTDYVKVLRYDKLFTSRSCKTKRTAIKTTVINYQGLTKIVIIDCELPINQMMSICDEGPN